MLRFASAQRLLNIGLVTLAAWIVVHIGALRTAEAPSQAAAELAKIVDRLDALAKHFDADKNQVLSSEEIAESEKYITNNYGQKWGERLRRFIRAADVNADGALDLVEFKRAIDSLRRTGSLPLEKQTTMVAMGDGVRLATDVYLPEGDGPFPVLFQRTPYSRIKAGDGLARASVPQGYAVVVQDMRGRFDSDGDNLPFIGCGWGEHQDGVESLAWIRKQPWANGKIATVGGSAAGITQNLLAGAGPPGLTAQYISVAAASMFHQAVYVGGALRKCQFENWTARNRFDPRSAEITKAHPAYDEYWRQFDTRLKFAEMDAPAVHVGGWFDTFAQGTIDSFVGRQHQGAEGARGKQKLVMGPWAHAVGRAEATGDLVFPNGKVPQQYSATRWFDYHLRGVDNGVMNEPAVAYYVMGDTSDSQAPGNQWRYVDDWPVASRPTSFYFQQGGQLRTEKPTATDSSVEYTFDPSNPCPTIGGNNLTIPAGPRNQNPIESRADMVLFTSGPLAEPLEVTGRLTARVFVASSAVDTDLSIRLCDVYPDGKSYNIADGMLRLRYRNSMEKPEPLTPGEVVEASVDCWSTSIVFNRGHRLRVTVTSSNEPRFDVNPGTGKAWVAGEPSVRQTNRVYGDAAHPSCIVLPVVEAR